MAKKLKSKDAVEEVSIVTGSVDMIAKIRVKDIDELNNFVQKFGAKGLLWIKVQDDGSLQSPAVKFFKDDEKENLKKELTLVPGDIVFIISNQNWLTACQILGEVRLNIGKKLGLRPHETEGVATFWVVDFPLYEFDEKENRFAAAHHPFTSPKPEHEADLVAGRNLRDLKASAYDLVLNGVEIAGGSLRIYNPDVQAAMFKAIGLSDEDAKEKFGFFLEALQYGTPPHGGIAFGIERLVALMSGGGPIRDVMAFPKTQKGACLMSGAPSPVNPEQLVELGISKRI